MKPVLVLVVAATALGAQQQPTFRGGTRMVPVYVTVTDGAGGFAVDLTRDDFEVRDNGKVQEIAQFTTAPQPLSVVLLLDGSSSMMPVFRSVIEAANSFILRMLAADRTAIASFADQFQMRQPFTSDRDELLAHLRNEFNIRMGPETRLWGALVESVLAVGKEQGRRVVVVLSDGRNWAAGAQIVPPQSVGRPGGMTTRIVTVPSASGSGSPGTVLSQAIDRDVMIYAVAMWTRSDGRAEAPDERMMGLAEDTGGGFVQLRESDDIGAAFTRISQELHRQYVLGFVPQVLDGKTHKLDVRVKRPGARVRARRSYLASQDAGVGR